MIVVYRTILGLGRATINEIKNACREERNLSYSQVNHAVKRLLEHHAIEHHLGAENTYTAVDPAQFFEIVREEKLTSIKELEISLSDLYNRSSSDFGQCTVQTNNFHFSSLELGFKILEDRFFKKARVDIKFLAPPPLLITRLRWSLQEAYERGVHIEFHYSNWDFEELPDFFNAIRDTLTFRVDISRRKHRVYEATSINDEYTRVGSIFVDDTAYIMVPYYRASKKEVDVEYGIDFLHGFNRFSSFIPQILAGLGQNPIEEQISFIPPRESMVLEHLKQQKEPIPTRELSKQLKISGQELKKILSTLQQWNEIEIRKVSNGPGRPARVIQLKLRW